MGREPISTANITRIFAKIEGQIEPAADPKLGGYLLELVKNPDEFKRYRANPARALQAKGLNPRLVKSDVLTSVVQSVIDRLTDLDLPGNVMDEVTKSETNQSQERNFDHSSSWFTNKDGWNVMHEAGHSAEKSSSSAVGSQHKFEGIGIADFGEVMQQRLNALFYPAQPLVSPKLVDQIKAAAKEIGQ